MVRVRIIANEISPEGELVERLAAAFEVRGQEFELTEGEARYVQLGMPVYSDLYGSQIDFDTDGEEWARNLPSAYRNGGLIVDAETVAFGDGASRELKADDRLAARQALAAE
jgi:hypothetical protein